MTKKDLEYQVKLISEVRNQNEFCGALSALIFSKDLFKRNSEVADIVTKFYPIEFKKYMFSSRTLMVGKVVKELTLLKFERMKTIELRNTLLDKLDATKGRKEPKKRKRAQNSVNGIIKMMGIIAGESTNK